jgi:hypothetical protein
MDMYRDGFLRRQRKRKALGLPFPADATAPSLEVFFRKAFGEDELTKEVWPSLNVRFAFVDDGEFVSRTADMSQSTVVDIGANMFQRIMQP